MTPNMNMTEQHITVGVFDDHPVVLDGIARAMDEHPETFRLLFTASAKDDLLEEVRKVSPRVLVLDIISADVNALELFEYFRGRYPSVSIIAHSSLTTPALIQNLLFLGVKGFVNKRQPIGDLLHAISLVAEGHVSVPEDYKYLTSKYHSEEPTLLSEREIEIVNLIANEFNSAQIAEKLQLSVNTIENHRKRIFFKLNVKNVAGMVLEASRLAYIRER